MQNKNVDVAIFSVLRWRAKMSVNPCYVGDLKKDMLSLKHGYGGETDMGGRSAGRTRPASQPAQYASTAASASTASSSTKPQRNS
jgi:hypothetical protein